MLVLIDIATDHTIRHATFMIVVLLKVLSYQFIHYFPEFYPFRCDHITVFEPSYRESSLRNYFSSNSSSAVFESLSSSVQLKLCNSGKYIIRSFLIQFYVLGVLTFFNLRNKSIPLYFMFI